jgi:hypothetical protein
MEFTGSSVNGLNEAPPLFLESAPVLSSDDNVRHEGLDRLVRKFDPADRDDRNRALGLSGEETILVTPKHLMGCRVLVCSRDVRAAR